MLFAKQVDLTRMNHRKKRRVDWDEDIKKA